MSWFREPLVQLLLAGGVLYAGYYAADGGAGGRWGGPPLRTSQQSIVLTAEGVSGLAREWENTMGAAPTPVQLQGQIEQHLQTELLYREALRLGLDVDDLVVKRRMAQKMQFLLEYTTPAAPPKQSEIQAYYEQHLQAYMRASRVDFSHVFVSRDRHQAATTQMAKDLFGQIAGWRPQPGQPVEYGDAFFSGQHFAGLTHAQIARTFDPALAAHIVAQPEGQWSGPVASVFGAHLLWVHKHQPAQPLPLVQVRDKVAAQIQRERQGLATQAAMEELRQRYRIEVDHPSWNKAAARAP